MIQRIVKVKSAETLPTKDGKKTYLSVVLSDGTRENKYSIFDPALQKTLQDAHKSGESVNVGLEKEGNFWNVKTAEITTDKPQTTTSQPTTQVSRYTKNEDAIMLQVAFKGAIELETHHTVPEGKLDKSAPRVVQATDTLFVGLQEIMKSRCGNYLVAEAKKLGAVEVE